MICCEETSTYREILSFIIQEVSTISTATGLHT
jgi:hypothetical protein